MTISKLKVAICAVWVTVVCGMLLFRVTDRTNGQTMPIPNASGDVADAVDIEAFDRAVQKRFLTQPNFGIRRIAPTEPEPLESGHVRSFYPVNDDERALLSSFEKNGLNVGLYLFGKRTLPNRPDKEPLKNFKVRYRINLPVPITRGLNSKDLLESKKMIDEIRTAFDQFQTSTSEGSELFQFTKGETTYIAKPVRALQSCLECHTDYVVLESLKNKRLKVRKRAVGDVNGVIVYAVSKREQ